MAIDYNGIVDKFILVAQEALPTQLSFIGISADLPAVFRVRQEGLVTPDYPYVTIDVLSTVDESGWLLQETVDSNDNIVQETNKHLLINYRVYGGNAIDIANRLHGFFRLDRVLGDIRSTLGGAITILNGIEQLPILLSDKWLESASFNMTFAITDTFVDTSGSEVFDTINIAGEVADEGGNIIPIP